MLTQGAHRGGAGIGSGVLQLTLVAGKALQLRVAGGMRNLVFGAALDLTL
jgi:hypothetical protein